MRCKLICIFAAVILLALMAGEKLFLLDSISKASETETKMVRIPVVMSRFDYNYAKCDQFEENDTKEKAWGPLRPDQPYRAKICGGDAQDNYWFEAAEGQVSVTLQIPQTLQNHTAIWLYQWGNWQVVCGMGPVTAGSVTIQCGRQRAGKYLLKILSENSQTYYDESNLYELRVTYTQPAGSQFLPANKAPAWSGQ